MEEKKKEIRISVRNLVEFILRSGDLDNSSGGFGLSAMPCRRERGCISRFRKNGAPITVRRFRWFTKKNMSISSCASREEQTACDEDGTTTVIEEIKGTYRDL